MDKKTKYNFIIILVAFLACITLTDNSVGGMVSFGTEYSGTISANSGYINYIKMMATNISATDCLSNWVYNVNSEGTFVKNASAEWTLGVGASGIPTNFTVTTASS